MKFFKLFFVYVLLFCLVNIFSSFVFAGDVTTYIDPWQMSDSGNLSSVANKISSRLITSILGIIGIAVLAVFVYAGIRYIAARGKKKEVETANNIMKYALIGLLIVFLSYAFVSFFFENLVKLG